MKASLNWLNDHLDLSGKSIEEMADLLTFAGIEVEGIEQVPDQIVVARVVRSEKHPDADKLSVCQVDDGTGKLRQIVCGARNYGVGDKVPLALPGADFGGGFVIKEGKLRGVESHGMMCSAKELGLSEDADGLMILPEDLETGTSLREVFPPVFEIEITPNRPDLLSHLGLARELAALTGIKLKSAPALLETDVPARTATDEEIRISDTGTCPYYTARTIRGVKVGPGPQWLQDKLNAIGLRPINNVVDITNYVLMEMGHPLHAFDLARVEGGIHVRPAREGEEFAALDGGTYRLTEADCVIADHKNALALGGVMGGELSGVTETTTDVLLEAAWFTPSSIRRTSHRHELHSDSSYRFERGADPAQVLGASALATRLILEIAGGKADEEVVVCGEAPVEDAVVPLDNKQCRRLIGHEVSNAEISGILKSLGLKKVKEGWRVPSYRLDLRRPVDLMEEVARVYDLDRVPSRFEARFVPPSKADADYDFRRRVRQKLSHLGFHECQTIKLISEAQLADDVVTQHRKMSPIRVKNPMTDTHAWLRPGLTPSLLRVAEHNVRMGFHTLRLFEMGTVFVANPKGVELEQSHLAMVLTGDREPASWQEADPGRIDLAHLRAVLEALCPGAPLRLVPVEDERLLVAAEIQIGKTRIGLAGQLFPARARQLDLEQPVYAAELSLKKLAAAIQEAGKRFTGLPRFPAITRDVAVEAPIDLPNQEIVDCFAAAREPLLETVKLFDVFTDPSGEKLPADKKSLAYSLTYRDTADTLQAARIDQAHAQILDGLKKKLPVSFR